MDFSVISLGYKDSFFEVIWQNKFLDTCLDGSRIYQKQDTFKNQYFEIGQKLNLFNFFPLILWYSMFGIKCLNVSVPMNLENWGPSGAIEM